MKKIWIELGNKNYLKISRSLENEIVKIQEDVVNVQVEVNKKLHVIENKMFLAVELQRTTYSKKFNEHFTNL